MAEIFITGGSAVESSSSRPEVTFTITLSEPLVDAATVNYRIVDGTAIRDIDYADTSGQITFAPGEISQTVSVIVEDIDNADEDDESFFLELFDPVGADLSSPNATLRALGVIQDDDGSGNDLGLFVTGGFIREDDSGSRNANFIVGLSQDPSSPIELAYATRDIDALSGEDYTEQSGILTFSAGQTVQTVSVPILGDTTREAVERFSLIVTPTGQIANGANNAVGIMKILDDDSGNGFEPVVSVSGGYIVEGSSSSPDIPFVVMLSEPSVNAVTADFLTIAGTADTSNDFTRRLGSVTFDPGETLQVVTVRVEDIDSRDEPDESVILELTDATGAVLANEVSRLRATGFIRDDDGAGLNRALSVSDIRVIEGDSGEQNAVVDILLSRPTDSTLTIPFLTANSGATGGEDFVPQSGDATFLPGETLRTVTVPVIGDTLPEPTEEATLVVATHPLIANGTDDSAGQIVILDDDSGNLFSPEISIRGGSVVESSSSSPRVDFVLTLSAPSNNAVTVGYRTVAGTASVGNDFFDNAGTITFAPGETAQILSIFVEDIESVDETDENFLVELFDPEGAVLTGGASLLQANGIILDDDGVGLNRGLFVTGQQLTEGDSGQREAIFDLELSRPSDTVISLNYETVDISTTAGTDYTARSGTVVFSPGQTKQRIAITILPDSEVEASEEFALVITPTQLIANRSQAAVGIATLIDDDAGSDFTPTISLRGGRVVESSDSSPFVEFVATLSQPSAQAVQVDYRTVQGTATNDRDMFDARGSIVFSPGEISETVRISIQDIDSIDETDESFFLELYNPDNAVFAGDADRVKALGVILDDDGPGLNLGLFTSAAAVTEGDSGDRLVRFDVNLSRPSDTPIALDYVVDGGSALASEDFTAGSGRITFAPGQTKATVPVQIFGDVTLEQTEALSLILTPTIDIANRTDGAAATLDLLDDDAGGPMVPTLSLFGGFIEESSSSSPYVEFTAILSEPTNQTVRADVSTRAGTATESSDYTSVNAPLIIPAGDTIATVRVFVQDIDSNDEADETFFLDVTDITGAAFAGGLTTLSAMGVIQDDDGAGVNTSVFVNDIQLVEPDSGTGTAAFEILLSRPQTDSLRIDYETMNGTALAGTDYVASSGTLIVQPGQTRAFVTVPVIGDAVRESDETFDLRLTGFTGVALAEPVSTAVVTATLLNGADTAEPISALGDRVYADYNGDGIQDDGEPGLNGIEVTLRQGTTTLATTTTDSDGAYRFDGLSEGTYTVSVARPLNAAALTGDPDGGDDDSVTVNVIAGADRLDIDFGYQPTFDFGDAPASYGTLLADGGPAHAFVLSRDDGGTSIAALPFNAGLRLGTAKDAESDGLPGALANRDDITGAFDDEDAIDAFPTLTAGTSSTVTVSYEADITGVGATAALWIDFDADGQFETAERIAQSVNTGSETGTLTFTIATPEAAAIGTTAARLRISSDSNALLTPGGFAPDGEVEDYAVTIQERPVAQLDITAIDADLPEGDAGQTAFTFRIDRSVVNEGVVSINYTVVGATTNPVQASDFINGTLPSGIVSFGAGETSRTVTIPVAGDGTFEPDEGFAVLLSNAVDARIGIGQAQGTIRNDDVQLSLAALDADQLEGDTGIQALTFEVVRTGAREKTVSVDYDVTGLGQSPATAADFANGALPSGRVTLAAFQTSANITVPVQGDTAVEATEAFEVTLSNPANATLSTTSAVGVIGNDDFYAEDSFENNDTITTPADLEVINTSRTISNLTINPGDDDWYRFTLPQNGKEADIVTLKAPLSGGDLELELYSLSGTRIAFSTGPFDTEKIALSGMVAGDYLIRVYERSAAGHPDYELSINRATSAVPADRFEDNDTLATATDLGVLSGYRREDNLTIETADIDFYRFTIPDQPGRSVVAIGFDTTQSALDLRVLNEIGEEITGALRTDGLAVANLGGLPGGTYIAEVRSLDDGPNGRYGLVLAVAGEEASQSVSFAPPLTAALSQVASPIDEPDMYGDLIDQIDDSETMADGIKAFLVNADDTPSLSDALMVVTAFLEDTFL